MFTEAIFSVESKLLCLQLLDDMCRTAGGECEIAFTENRERHFWMLAQSRQRFPTPLQSEQDPTISDP